MLWNVYGSYKQLCLSIFFQSESEIAQSCLTLCDLVDCSPPGSSIHGILQARILEWVVISFSRESSRPRDRTQVPRIAGRHFNLWATREDFSIYPLVGTFLEKAIAPHSSTLAWKIPWTAAYQAPPSMGFSRQEYWSGVPLPSPYNTAHCHKSSIFLPFSIPMGPPSIWSPQPRTQHRKGSSNAWLPTSKYERQSTLFTGQWT